MNARRCEIDGCDNRAVPHIQHGGQYICASCATDLAECEREPAPVVEARFPRAAVMLEAVAIAEVLRNAAAELDELAGAAPAYEIGTLRRKVRAVVLGALAFAEGSAELDGAP
jgi:hypothetical protein